MSRIETPTIFRYFFLVVLALLDRFLKTLVQQPVFLNSPVGLRYLGFEQFHNFGIAFGIPIPLPIVIVLSIGFIIFLFHRTQKTPVAHFPFALILTGALSNITDRVAYGYTIDYIRILNSIINIADLLVIFGVFMLLRTKK